MSCRVFTRDIMSVPPIVLSSGGLVRDAARLMWRHRIGSIVIVESNRPVGIFTERDLVRCVGEFAEKALGMNVLECGSTDLVVIDADDCIYEAFHIFVKVGVRHIPVVDEKGVIVGVLSLRDVARKLIEMPELLLDLISLGAPEVSRDILYVLIKNLELTPKV